MESVNVIPPQFYAPAASLASVLALWLLKTLIMGRLKQWSAKTAQRWDDVLVHAISFPANFLIIASGIVIFMSLLSVSEETGKFLTIALQACVVIAAVMFLDRFVKGFLDAYASKSFFSNVSHSLTKGILRGFIIGLGVLIFLDLIGISITPILASLGIGSLAVALALQDTLSNFFAGIYVSIDKPVNVGDFIRLENGDEGYVTDIGWRNTRIRTLPNNVIVIPNSKLTSAIITNYYLPDKEIAVLVNLGVHYKSDLKHVEKVTAETAKEVMQKVTGGIPGFEPFIRYHTFGDSSIGFTVIMRGKEFTDQYLLKHEFIKLLHERYKKEGIEIPFPIRTIHLPSDSPEAIKTQFKA